MFANSNSILVKPIQRDDLIQNVIDCRLIDVQNKITSLLNDGYTIYDVASATNNSFNNLIASSSGNRICVWKSAGSSAYTLYSTELASNGTNVIINATINNMNQVTSIRECQLTCSASSGLFANKAEFYGGDWIIANWSTGSNVKFSNCDVEVKTTNVYFPDVNFDYCNVRFSKSVTIAYSTYKENKDTRFVNETTAGSTVSTLTLSYAYTTSTDWFTRCTIVDCQNTATAVLSSTAQRTFNFTGLKLENSNLTMTNFYTTEGNKIYYEGQDLSLIGNTAGTTWQQVGTTNISSSSGLYPSLVFNNSGIPYVAFKDNSTGGAGKASCYKYGSTGWVIVGYIGLSSNTMDYVNLLYSTETNQIFVAGRDNSSKATVYYLSEAASSWNLLGSAGFSTNNVSKLDAAILNGGAYTTPAYKSLVCVAVSNTSQSPYIDLYTYNVSNTTAGNVWTHINQYNNVGTSSLINVMTDFKLSFGTNVIYGGGYSYNGNILSINSTGSIDSWQISGYDSPITLQYWAGPFTTLVGVTYIEQNKNEKPVIVDASSKPTVIASSSSFTGYINFSTGTAKYPTIKTINGIQHVAFQDTTGKASCYKYVSANSSWNLVGTAQFSTDNVNRVSLATWNNVPYIAVEEVAAPGIALYKFDEQTLESNINYTFENLETDVFDGDKSIDITTIQSTANYIVQNCKVKPIYNIVDTAVGRFIRNEYNIELAPRWNPPVNETLKNTNSDTFWVVKREDIEATLNGLIIKNNKLYTAGLELYNYQSNDNFIIIANNIDKGNAVFCFYNNKIKGTVFSDWFLDTAYTITDCIILMEVNEIADLVNFYSSTQGTDVPMESGSITFNSYDNEIII